MTTPAIEASARFMAVADRLPSAPRLYDLTAEWQGVWNALEDCDLSDTEQAEALTLRLEQIEGQIQHKAESAAGVIRSLESLARMCDAESDRLRQRAEAIQRRADWLRAYVLSNLQQAGMTRVETTRFTLRVIANGPAVQVLDASAIPPEFNRTKIIIEPDKTAIKRHLRETGEVVPGVTIARGHRLDIS